MRERIRACFALAVLSWLAAALPAQAALVPFHGTLEITVSTGTMPGSFQLLSVPVSGTAEVTGTTVRIAAGEISAAVPAIAGFGGTLVNGAARFSTGGAGARSTCPLLLVQEVCIGGNGFGGAMALAGVTQAGQSLVAWGLGTMQTGMTASGLSRVEQARLWTEGNASAWYFIPEVDPTPFVIAQVGSFRGLPATQMEDAGFSLVTPLAVTAASVSTADNVRVVARLRIDFAPRPVPLAGACLVAALLALTGSYRLAAPQRRTRAARRDP